MTYGLNVTNANDIVLIDQDFSNYAVFAEGTLPNGSAGLTTSFPDELIYYTLDTNGGSAAYDQWGGTWAVSGVLRYIRMRPMSAAAPGSETWGLQVYDSQSKTVFDSSSRYIKPVGMYSYLPYGANTNYSLPATTLGRKLWFSGQVFKLIECQDTGMGFGDLYCSGIIRNSATSWTVSGSFTFMGPPGTFANSFASFFFLVIEA